VALAAVIGVPDPIRGQVVKAVIQLARGVEPTEALELEIRDLVRNQLAPYEYPRYIEFIDEMPLTVTGKMRRRDLREAHEQGMADAGNGDDVKT
jgi:acetyl-CoA synthetase